MIALKVKHNDQLQCIAGAEDLSVLGAHVQTVGKLGYATQHNRDNGYDLRLRVGGLTSRASKSEDEHLNWCGECDLQIGDIVEIEILSTETPAERHPYDCERQEERLRDQWEAAKELYLLHKKTFEGDD